MAKKKQTFELDVALDALCVAMDQNGARVSGTCIIRSTAPMICPLCRVRIPANTLHQCERRA
jgi:hypothetical protein